MVKGVIFDMDGTMFDTEPLSARCWILAGKEMGVDMAEEIPLKCRGKTRDAIRRIFLDALGKEFDFELLYRIKNRIFMESLERDGVILKKGLLPLLRYLRQKNIPAAVATSSGRDRVSRSIARAGVGDYFQACICGDMVKDSKPAPEIFLKAAATLGLSPGDCLVLEDSAAGVLAGKAAGGYTIYIPDMEPVPEDEKQGITAQMKDLEEVIGWIERENGGNCQ
ncbi:MAG: HAD family phosphatase [Clostridiales bacterium]|nr:HAD family phosphatase [Clostridiales bacterium]